MVSDFEEGGATFFFCFFLCFFLIKFFLNIFFIFWVEKRPVVKVFWSVLEEFQRIFGRLFNFKSF